MINNEYLNKVIGKPITGIDVSYRSIDLGRQRGKTSALIDALPEDRPCVVVTGSTHVALDIKRRLENERPSVNAKFVVCKSLDETFSKLKENTKFVPVFVDNQFWEEIVLRDIMKKFHAQYD